MSSPNLKSLNECYFRRKKQQTVMTSLVRLINRSLALMIKRQFKLEQIAKEHSDFSIRTKAEKYLSKQNKMISITEELEGRILATYQLTSNGQPILDKLIHGYLREIDLMNFMDFKVTKTYLSFIVQHYQPKVIELKRLTA